MVLDVAKTAGFPLGIKKRIAGVRLYVTDIDWQWGDGPEIRGPGEAIFFAMLKNACCSTSSTVTGSRS